MRLICPNCDAQYEVPENVMPVEGRDVQCSDCGETWFQEHPEYPGDVERAVPPPPVEPAEDEVEPPAIPASTPEPAQRRALDPAVADVLRAEAALEARARKKDAQSVEIQPDLGLSDTFDQSQKRARKVRDSLAGGEKSPAPTPKPEAPAQPPRPASRRDLLPDIEEINSTLRSNNDRSSAKDSGTAAQAEGRQKRKAWRGFLFAVAIAGLAALVYLSAADLTESIPQAGPALEAYVAHVDVARAWLDTQFSAAVAWYGTVTQ